ncbi:MAG TPA: endonuclease [Stenomitos sp.]
MRVGSKQRKVGGWVVASILLGLLATACSAPATLNSQRLDGQTRAFRAQDAPTGYYDAAKDKTGRDLLVALSRIIGNQRDLGYDAARDAMFGWIDDPQGLDTIECVYTGRRLTGVTDRKTAFRNGQGLDTEHTWPQSLGAKSGPARSDLHHLFPTDVKANSSRGNAPFGEVMASFILLPEYPLLQDQSRAGNDERGRLVFEPRGVHKGNVARALLYFYTRYGLKSPSSISLKNFQAEKAVLVQWHLQDPVDDAERLRNDAIYKAQGNRNPYVDHPEYVAMMGPLD